MVQDDVRSFLSNVVHRRARVSDAFRDRLLANPQVPARLRAAIVAYSRARTVRTTDAAILRIHHACDRRQKHTGGASVDSWSSSLTNAKSRHASSSLDSHQFIRLDIGDLSPKLIGAGANGRVYEYISSEADHSAPARGVSGTLVLKVLTQTTVVNLFVQNLIDVFDDPPVAGFLRDMYVHETHMLYNHGRALTEGDSPYCYTMTCLRDIPSAVPWSSYLTIVNKSVDLMHANGIIHGDLKVDNIMADAPSRLPKNRPMDVLKDRGRIVDMDTCVRSEGMTKLKYTFFVLSPTFIHPIVTHMHGPYHDLQTLDVTHGVDEVVGKRMMARDIGTVCFDYDEFFPISLSQLKSHTVIVLQFCDWYALIGSFIHQKIGLLKDRVRPCPRMHGVPEPLSSLISKFHTQVHPALATLSEKYMTLMDILMSAQPQVRRDTKHTTDTKHTRDTRETRNEMGRLIHALNKERLHDLPPPTTRTTSCSVSSFHLSNSPRKLGTMYM